MNKNKSLFVVRSPFQAWLCIRIINSLRLNFYDLLYVTHNDSEEDHFYFSALSKKAEKSEYIFVTPSPFDIFTHLKLRWKARFWFLRSGYDSVYIGSINSHVINSLASRFSDASLYTFDDGAANLVEDGPYYKSSSSFRWQIYRALFRAQPVEKVREKISRHFTIYRGYKNIVDDSRLFCVEGWSSGSRSKTNSRKLGKVKRYFIGAPFHEVMNKVEIDAMVRDLSCIKIDGYIMHPREKEPLPINAPVIDKAGRIAEDIILNECDGYSLELFGYLSSVMLNLRGFSDKRVVFVPQRNCLSGIVSLAKISDCQVIYLNRD